jgi:hypothetical protein
MERDCGKGELIPVGFRVAYCKGRKDKEVMSNLFTLEDALFTYNTMLNIVKSEPFSDVRLYAEDSKKYMNCIRATYISADGEQINGLDRVGEL